MPKGHHHNINGFIKVYRSITNHWLWQSGNEIKLKWWLSVLLEVNHTDQKKNLGYGIIDCKRGQSIKSLGTWGKEWRTSKNTVRNFFLLLKADGMVEVESVGISTRLTVCNYESYQDKKYDNNLVCVDENIFDDQKSVHLNGIGIDDYKDSLNGRETAAERSQYAGLTQTKNDKNVKKERDARAKDFYNLVAEHVNDYPKEMLRAFYDYWSELNKTGRKMRWELQTTFEVKKRLATWASREKDFGTGKNETPHLQAAPLQKLN